MFALLSRSVVEQSSGKGDESSEGVGREYNCDRLKGMQTSSLAAVTRKGMEITRLMTNNSDLHLVKTAVEDINTLCMNYQEIHQAYTKLLSSEELQERETQRYKAREKSFLDFRQQV